MGPGVVGVAKGHPTVRVAQEVLLRQHPAIEVASEVGQCLVAVADRIAVDHPLRRQVGLDGPAEFLHRGEPRGPENLAQGLVGEEELPRLAIPVAGAGVDSPRGQYDMHVGMAVEGAAVGVQHRGGAQVPVQRLVTQPERGEGLPGEADEQSIGFALPFEPGLAGLMLAQRAEAVAAGQGEDLGAVAVVAADAGGAQCLGAALLDRRQGLAVAGQQPGYRTSPPDPGGRS